MRWTRAAERSLPGARRARHSGGMVRSLLLAALLFAPAAAKAGPVENALDLLAVHRVAEAQPLIAAAMGGADADALRQIGDALVAAGAYDRAATVFDREIALRAGGPRTPLAAALGRRAQATVGGLRYGFFSWHRSDAANARIAEGVRFADRALAALAEAADPPYAARFEILAAAHHLFALAPEWVKGRETSRRLLRLIMGRMDFAGDEVLTARDTLLVSDLPLLNSQDPFRALHHRTFGNAELFALRRIADAYTYLNPSFRFQDVEYFFDVALFETGAGGLRAAEMAMMAGDRYREINTDDRRNKRPIEHARNAGDAYACAAGFYGALYGGAGTRVATAWLRAAAAYAAAPDAAPTAVAAGARGAAIEAVAAVSRRKPAYWARARAAGVQGLFAALDAARFTPGTTARAAALGFQALDAPLTDPLTPHPEALDPESDALARRRGAALDALIRAESDLAEALAISPPDAAKAGTVRLRVDEAREALRALDRAWAEDPARNARFPLVQPGFDALGGALGADEGLLVAAFRARVIPSAQVFGESVVDVSILTLAGGVQRFGHFVHDPGMSETPSAERVSTAFAEALAAALAGARSAHEAVRHWHVVAALPPGAGGPARKTAILAAAPETQTHASLAAFIAAQGGRATPDAERGVLFAQIAEETAAEPAPTNTRPPVGCRTEPL